jgi:hypothetical protein
LRNMISQNMFDRLWKPNWNNYFLGHDVRTWRVEIYITGRQKSRGTNKRNSCSSAESASTLRISERWPKQLPAVEASPAAATPWVSFEAPACGRWQAMCLLPATERNGGVLCCNIMLCILLYSFEATLNVYKLQLFCFC